MLSYRNISVGFVVVIFLLVTFWIFDRLSIIWLALPVFIFLLLLVLGAIKIQWNFYTKSIHALPSANQILLSFDDGPHPQFTLPILNLLDQYHVKAVFFLIGKQAETYPELVSEIFNRGHVIGNHTYTHAHQFDFFSLKRMEDEVFKTNEIIQKIVGEPPVLFRPPFGVTNPRIHRLIVNSGMISVGWSFRSFDTTSLSNAHIIKKIRKNIKGKEILLFHDRVERSYQILAAVLPELLNSFELVNKIDEV